MRLEKVSHLCTRILNVQIMVQGKKTFNNNKPKFAEVVIGDSEAKEMRVAENGGYPPTQNGDIRSLFWLFSLMALQN